MDSSLIYVITSRCSRQGACVKVCPVDCIVPGPDGDEVWEKQYYIDPLSCVGCGECISACPSGAIFSEGNIPSEYQDDVIRNILFFEEGPGYWNNDFC